MDVPRLTQFQGKIHTISDRCVLGQTEDPESEWYIWFTPKRGESRTFVVNTVEEGIDIGNTIEINSNIYRVDDIEIYKRNKKGKIKLTLL